MEKKKVYIDDLISEIGERSISSLTITEFSSLVKALVSETLKSMDFGDRDSTPHFAKGWTAAGHAMNMTRAQVSYLYRAGIISSAVFKDGGRYMVDVRKAIELYRTYIARKTEVQMEVSSAPKPKTAIPSSDFYRKHENRVI